MTPQGLASALAPRPITSRACGWCRRAYRGGEFGQGRYVEERVPVAAGESTGICPSCFEAYFSGEGETH